MTAFVAGLARLTHHPFSHPYNAPIPSQGRARSAGDPRRRRDVMGAGFCGGVGNPPVRGSERCPTLPRDAFTPANDQEPCRPGASTKIHRAERSAASKRYSFSSIRAWPGRSALPSTPAASASGADGCLDKTSRQTGHPAFPRFSCGFSCINERSNPPESVAFAKLIPAGRIALRLPHRHPRLRTNE